MAEGDPGLSAGDGARALGGRRIAFDARYLRDAFGGIGRFGYCLLDALSGAAASSTFLVYYDEAVMHERYALTRLLDRPNVIARRVSLPLYSACEQLLWPALLARDRADLFYSPYFVLPLFSPVPAVGTVHDLMFEREGSYAGGLWKRYYYRPMLRLGLRRAALTLTVSQSTRRDLVAYYGLSPRRVAVVSEAAAGAFTYPQPEEAIARVRQALALPERFVLCLGARRPHKNFGLAVRAFFAAQPEVPHTLVVVGRPERRYADEVAQARAALGPALRLREIEAVADEDLPALYAAADCLLMPSLHEGFGLPALEAMACGTPVVAGDRTALPEVVGEAGLLVDPTDLPAVAAALYRVLTDAELRAGLRERGPRRAAGFSWQRSAALALEAMETAIGHQASPSG